MTKLSTILAHNQPYQPVLPSHLQHGQALLLDMNAPQWQNIDISNPEALQAQTLRLMQYHNADIAIGHYGEDRAHIYRRSELFHTATELRSVHLGIDLMVPSGTPVYAPIGGTIHSFADHYQYGDYGPTLLIAHELAEQHFYTLYAHLSRTSLKQWSVSQSIQPGQYIGNVGSMEENGQWPCHLHFQIIDNLMGYHAGYPGVASPSEAHDYLTNCPNPNLILGLDALKAFNTV